MYVSLSKMKGATTILILNFSLYLFAQDFNETEQAYITDNPIVYYGFDPNWKPLEFMEEGMHIGVSRDYLDLIEQRSGIQFIQHPEVASWDDTKRLFHNAEIGLITAIAISSERTEYIDFTSPYMSFPFVIVTRNDAYYYGSMKSLKGKKIAAPKGYYISILMEEDPTDFELIYKETIEDCLMAVATKEVEATVANLCVASHFLNYRGFKNLQIAAPTHYQEMIARMGVQKGDSLLQSIITKSIESLSVRESNEIMNKWVSIAFNEGISSASIFKYGGISLGGILLIIGGIIYWNRTLKKEIVAKKRAEKELQSSYDEIKEQKQIIEIHNKEIMDSIRYAKRIQSAILPPNSIVKEYLKESFILYKPKDIVAGDFYWMENKYNTILFAAADCTGHGVPGALVSVVCNNGLNRSVREYELTDPGEILNKTRDIVIQEFEKSEEEVSDGMDIALCCLESQDFESDNATSFTVRYAGANNPFWIIRKGSNIVEELKGDKQPIGKYAKYAAFKTHELSLSKGDTIYLFSDGFQDQFGGKRGKKFKPANFKKLLIAINHEPMQRQKEILEETFENWKGELEQVDDVCVIGVRL
jgi:serine phosphatase RsbU (regulator of sigma subunit)/ABC-type amino acid transport substrate-binding protein